MIEENFKLIKKTTNINKNNETTINNINKSFICYNIISKLSYLISSNYNMCSKTKSNNIKKVNNSILIASLYNYNFLIDFFSGLLNKKYITFFFKIAIIYVYSRDNRLFDRICKRSNHQSYFKNNSKNKNKCK